MAPAISIGPSAAEHLDALLASTSDVFGADFSDQPDPYSWTAEQIEAYDAPKQSPLLVMPAPKRSLRDRIGGVDLILETIEQLDDKELTPDLRDLLSAQLITELAGTRAKVDATSACLGMLEGLEASAVKEIKRLEARAARYMRQRESLELYVLATLEASKLAKIEGDISTLTARRNPASVVIDDLNAIPREFLKYAAPPPPPPATPDKQEIARALKGGREVAGARLTNSSRLVRS